MGAFRLYNKHQAKENVNNVSIREPTKLLKASDKLWRPWEEPATLRKHSFNCRFSDCDVTFKRESELRRHENSIHNRNTETCGVCLQVFTRKDNLTRHMKIKHKNPDHKPKCGYCKKRLSRQDAVQRHITTCPKNPLKQILVEQIQFQRSCREA